TDKDLNIAHPAQPFVALRAVGRDALHIAALRPEDVLPELVERWVRTFKAAGFRHRRMKDAACERIRSRFICEASDLDITKAVISKMWFVRFITTAAQCIRVGLVCAAQVVGVDRA